MKVYIYHNNYSREFLMTTDLQVVEAAKEEGQEPVRVWDAQATPSIIVNIEIED